jgi:hypothetical protein
LKPVVMGPCFRRDDTIFTATNDLYGYRCAR